MIAKYFILPGAVLAALQAAPELPPLNEKVLAYCRENVDKEVGNGECAGLAAQALKAAGARVHAGPDAPRERDYVWGREVWRIESRTGAPTETGSVADIRPGDILQFRDVKFGEKGGFAHHTAIVAEVVDGNLLKFQVYQQNAGGKRFVIKSTLHKFRDLQEGYILAYRPLPEK
jgi:hypothetical protein